MRLTTWHGQTVTEDQVGVIEHIARDGYQVMSADLDRLTGRVRLLVTADGLRYMTWHYDAEGAAA